MQKDGCDAFLSRSSKCDRLSRPMILQNLARIDISCEHILTDDVAFMHPVPPSWPLGGELKLVEAYRHGRARCHCPCPGKMIPDILDILQRHFIDSGHHWYSPRNEPAGAPRATRPIRRVCPVRFSHPSQDRGTPSMPVAPTSILRTHQLTVIISQVCRQEEPPTIGTLHVVAS